MFDSQSLDIPCPKCGKKTKKTVAWIKANKQFACSKCGSSITVEASKLLSGLKSVEKSLSDLKRKLGSIKL